MDPAQVRVACETFATTNRVVIGGETRGPSSVTHSKIEEAARRAIKAIGYEQNGFHWQTAKVEILLHGQSADIAQGVDWAATKDEGAGTRASCLAMPAMKRQLSCRRRYITRNASCSCWRKRAIPARKRLWGPIQRAR